MNEVKQAIVIVKGKLVRANKHNLGYQRFSIAEMEAVWGILAKADTDYAALKAERDALAKFRSMIFAALGAHESHEDFVARVNIENACRRSACLSAIERHFTVEVEDEDYDGEMMEQCPLCWGQEPEEYIETFKNALNSVRAEGVDYAVDELKNLAKRNEAEAPKSAEHTHAAALYLMLFANQLRKGASQ